MKLLTSLPARKDGTLNVVLKDGTAYKFTGEPLTCDVTDEDHIEALQVLGFMDQDEFDTEAKFQKQVADREAKRAASTAKPAKDDGDEFTTGSGLPIEENTPPTGRVRKAK